jgi:murine toxin
MSKTDEVEAAVRDYFHHRTDRNYVRILDTPNVWGEAYGRPIMARAKARQAEFQRALVEIVQKAQYRCDISSLNSPDPAWTRPILGAMDTALSSDAAADATQFRFLFGQTPMYPVGDPPNYEDLKAAIIRLFRLRSREWTRQPEIWMGRFYRLRDGLLSSIQAKAFGESALGSDGTKMTWNHSKIVAVDGTEALVGGHNLNMDLFRSYPPVHDVSVVVHGEAALSSQLFLNQMWECGSDLLSIEVLDPRTLTWETRVPQRSGPTDPLSSESAGSFMQARRQRLIEMHDAGVQDGAPDADADTSPRSQDSDLQTLTDIRADVFPERVTYTRYDQFEQYRLATGVLAVGKYWTGSAIENFQRASEVMKERLIKGANHSIRMSQMDLISAWKKNWSDHHVCQWLIEALLANKDLTVQVVVSPLDAGAGAEGDQYSFGSGASRTFDLIEYYMTHDAQTDRVLDDPDGARAEALQRLFVAPMYYTDLVPEELTVEGETYHWPDLPVEGYTATLKQPPIDEYPPAKGVIGSAAWSVINASGYVYERVPSAPGNHAKVMVVDDEAFIVGSDNLYPGNLSEFNFLIEGAPAVEDMLTSYWQPLWQYSGPHANTRGS